VVFVRADVYRLPFAPDCFDAAVDRGCSHYLRPGDRPRYSDELRRVLRPGGKYLLCASLRGWRAQRHRRGGRRRHVRGLDDRAHGTGEGTSDTCMLEVIVARMSAPQHHPVRGSRSATDGYT
jgi:SAM-dependent methyltransferase